MFNGGGSRDNRQQQRLSKPVSVFATPDEFRERLRSQSAGRAMRHKKVMEKCEARMAMVPTNLRIRDDAESDEDDDLEPRRLSLGVGDDDDEDCDL